MKALITLLCFMLINVCHAQHSKRDVYTMKKLLDEVDLSRFSDTVAKRFPDMEQHRYKLPLELVQDPAALKAADINSRKTVGPFPSINNSCAVVRIVEKDTATWARVSYIFLDKTSNTDEVLHARADSIYQAVQKGWPFADAAMKYSMDGNSERGGDLNWFTTSSMTEEFSASVVQHHKGELYTVRVAKYGWYVILVTEEPGVREHIRYLIARGPICQ